MVVVGCGVRLVVAEAHDEDRGVQRRLDRSCRTDDGVETDASLRLTEVRACSPRQPPGLDRGEHQSRPQTDQEKWIQELFAVQ